MKAERWCILNTYWYHESYSAGVGIAWEASRSDSVASEFSWLLLQSEDREGTESNNE